MPFLSALLLLLGAIDVPDSDLPQSTSADVAVVPIIEGTWAAYERGPSRLQLSVRRGGRGLWSNGVDLDALEGLTDDDLRAGRAEPVAFVLKRPAGRFEFAGTMQEGRGTGEFRFTPERSFASALRTVGVSGTDRITDLDLYEFALNGATAEAAHGFLSEGLVALSVDDLKGLVAHDVTPAYVRDLRAEGVAVQTGPEAVEAHVHDVAPAYVRALRAVGYEALSLSELVSLQVHDVEPGWVRRLQELGYRGLTVRQLVSFRVHDVTPSFIRAANAGGRRTTPDELVSRRVHDAD